MTDAKGALERAALLRHAIERKRGARRARRGALPSRPSEHVPRLAELQRSLWLLHHLDPQSPAYNLASAFRVEGDLDHTRLEASLSTVVARHRVLRSTFAAQAREVVQVLHPPSPCSVGTVTVSQGEAMAAAVREARRPFDLTQGPLVRMTVVCEGARLALLVLVMHHIISDERSQHVFWRELATAYDDQLSADEAPHQFDDYVYWLDSWGQDNRQAGLDYWTGRLDPPPDDLTLSFDGTADADTERPGRYRALRMGDESRQQVRRLAAHTGTTPFLVAAYAYRLLLARYGQGAKVAFATPVSTRFHPAAAEMIGYFLNPVVITASIDERQTVGEAVRLFSEDAKDAISHAVVPFDVVSRELAPARQRDRHPLFQSMFVFQEASPSPTLGTTHLEPVTLDLGASKFDLTVFVTEQANRLDVAIEYRADRFGEDYMRGFLEHYTTLLADLAVDPERLVHDLSLMTAAEEVRTDTDWQGPALPADQRPLVPLQILAQARRSPDRCAVVGEDRRWSYRELEHASRRVADALRSAGIGPGHRVGVCLERSAMQVASVVGTLWAGAAYAPVDPDAPPTRSASLLQDADVTAVLTTSSVKDRLDPGLGPVICVDELGDSDGRGDVPELDGRAPAYLLYTSGSTGGPKGVVVAHDNLRASTAARQVVYEQGPGCFLLLPNLTFDSSVAGLFWTLVEGGTLVIPSDACARDASQLARLVAREEVTTLLCVPTLYAHLLKTGREHLPSLTTVIVAGERCPSALVGEHLRAIPHARLFNEYGPTEATVWATVHEMTSRDQRRPVSIGRPIPGVSVHVRDGLGRAVPPGVPGQAWIAGPTVATGYWKRATLTAARFVVDHNLPSSRRRLYGSGDSVMWTPDGRLLFLGRQDDQIKLRGFRIEPGEIEQVLLDQEHIEEAAVVARTVVGGKSDADDSTATQLVAFLRVSHERSLDLIRESLRTRLPAFMLPSRYVTLADLPRLPNGKLDRQHLRTVPLDDDSPTTDATPAADAREQALVVLWEGLLGCTGIGVADNFFELGGHSMLVMAMTHHIMQDHGVTLHAADVFQNPTVRQLAQQIERAGGAAPSPYAHLFPLQPSGAGMPIVFCVPHFFSEMLANRFRGERPVYGLRGVSLRAEGNVGRWTTMTDLAAELVDETRRRFPDEPVVLAGYSFGASMAFEAARLMEEQGGSVACLLLIAPMPLDFRSFGPLRIQVPHVTQAVDELELRDVARLIWRDSSPFTRAPYRRAWLSLGVRPWRRVLCTVGRIRRLFGRPFTPRIMHADVRVERFRLHRRFQPRAIRTPTVIFNAVETETDAAATWRHCFDGPLTIRDTPDPHQGDDSVRRAREVILSELETLESRLGPIGAAPPAR